MIAKTRIALAATLVALIAGQARGEGLDLLRSEVRGGDHEHDNDHKPRRSDRRGKHHSHHGPHCDCRQCEDEDDSDAYALVGWMLTAPWWAPATALGDDWEHPAYFSPYPYSHTPGYLVIDRGGFATQGGKVAPPAFLSGWAGRFRAEYGESFGDLDYLGGHLLLSSSTGWGIDAEFNRRHDAAPGVADLWTGDVNMLFRFAQSERVTMRTGIGLNWLHDEAGTETGINLVYEFDLLLGKPWVSSTTIELGELGDASVVHFRTTLGVLWRRWEAYLGYDHYSVGAFDTNSLVSGVRLWF